MNIIIPFNKLGNQISEEQFAQDSGVCTFCKWQSWDSMAHLTHSQTHDLHSIVTCLQMFTCPGYGGTCFSRGSCPNRGRGHLSDMLYKVLLPRGPGGCTMSLPAQGLTHCESADRLFVKHNLAQKNGLKSVC